MYNDTNFLKLFYRDAVLTCVINTLTSIIPSVITFSILGFIAASQGTTVSDVVESGPGLVFITYPQVVLQLPGARIWAVVFFVMLAVGMTKLLESTFSYDLICIYMYKSILIFRI